MTSLDRNLEGIAMACVAECRRQHVGLDRLAFLLEGYNYAVENRVRLPSEGDILHLAGAVEPKTSGRYPDTPATSKTAGQPPTTGPLHRPRLGCSASWTSRQHPDEFTHHFLSVHPFADGNGRLAFILYNWLKHRLDDPLPLPEFELRGEEITD